MVLVYSIRTFSVSIFSGEVHYGGSLGVRGGIGGEGLDSPQLWGKPQVMGEAPSYGG